MYKYRPSSTLANSSQRLPLPTPTFYLTIPNRSSIAMRFAILSAVVTVAALFTQSEAVDFFIQSGALERKAACRTDILSCSTTVEDTCCSPKHGLLVLAQQWIRGIGPSDAFTMHGLWPNTW
ncbi:hypothetical protein BC938DRAFT_481921 [Jimgerdemannia flammicorona]|uniref:Uncharacterized protein n=1 Tax=Jimgerdemannia flammicorona TaxID=994334 RepID=A0A433QF20_9FUNG|nr:hypothetical protein BC938DRAFT_481921 [Jimgerdemannia flammicorona]